jgi:DNA-directed RNA polymerase specialized sigma24 family protein
MILSWVKNTEDAKDLTQDVFISAYLDLPSLKDHKRFYSWIRQIARHKCQNWKRKQIDFIPLDNNLISREPSADGFSRIFFINQWSTKI